MRNPCAVAPVTAALMLVSTAPAQIPEITWQPEEVLDAGIDDVSETPGASVAFFGGVWHLVYVKDGNVLHAQRDPGGWQIEPLTAFLPPLEARSPGLAVLGGVLHAVWEDNQGVVPHVRSRRHDGTAWSPEGCLSCTETLGRSPAISAGAGRAFAVWESEPGPGVPAVTGALFENGAWGLPQPVSSSPDSARQPAVAADPQGPSVYIVWSDTREGNAELYLRTLDSIQQPGWGPEVRLTNVGGAARRPSIHTEGPLSDAVADVFRVAFEVDDGVDTETWMLCYDAVPISVAPAASLPAARPNLTGFTFREETCELVFTSGRHVSLLVSSQHPLSASIHQLQHAEVCPSPADDTEPYFGHFANGAAVGAVEGMPDAGVAIAYVDAMNDLRARTGTLLGLCRDEVSAAPPAFLIAPEGQPGNAVTASNTCRGPMPSALLELRIAPASGLTFDPQGGSPPFFFTTDDSGRADLAVAGGGCDPLALASVTCPPHEWFGVRSPDIDGNCQVDQADLDYVDSMLGTADFCADLDGSGLVDALDRDIVEATLGDHCPGVTSVRDALSADGPGIAIFPNPAPGRATVRLSLGPAERARVRIVDVAGRQMRDLGAVTGPRAVLAWDGRDDRGRDLAAGRYFVTVRTGGRELSRPVLLLR